MSVSSSSLVERTGIQTSDTIACNVFAFFYIINFLFAFFQVGGRLCRESWFVFSFPPAVF